MINITVEWYEKLAIEYLNNNNYKVAVNDVYSRNKKYKVYETWFVHNDINFKEINYLNWKKNFTKITILVLLIK